MNRILLTCVFLLGLIPVSLQGKEVINEVSSEFTDRILLTEGASWSEALVRFSTGSNVATYDYLIQGDTVVDATTYKKVYCNGNVLALTRLGEDGDVYLRFVDEYAANDGWGVYFSIADETDKEEHKLYSFGDDPYWPAGSIVGWNYFDFNYCESVVETGDVTVERLYDGKEVSFYKNIAYGIGDLEKGPLGILQPDMDNGTSWCLTSFSFNDELLYYKKPIFVGAVWSNVRYEMAGEEEKYSFYRYTVLDEPTVLDGNIYYPLVKYTESCEYAPAESNRVYRIRQEGSKIFILKEDYPEVESVRLQTVGNDYLLYDFSLEAGDEFAKSVYPDIVPDSDEPGESISPITVSEVSTIDIDGRIFRTYEVDGSTWIEGLGNIEDFLSPVIALRATCHCGTMLNLYRNNGGDIIYKNPYEFKYGSRTEFKTDDCLLGEVSGTLTLSLNGLGLEKQILEEQRSEVIHLILKDGDMSEDDYAFIREGKLPNLQILDMKETKVEAIPNEAFDEWETESLQLNKLVLPCTLKSIGDKALGFRGNDEPCVVEFTGAFPTLGHNILYKDEYRGDERARIIVSEDNTECVLKPEGIYSSDGSIFYFYTGVSAGLVEIAAGTCIIAPHAFESSLFSTVVLPVSLVTIGDYAFYNLLPLPIPTGGDDYGNTFRCEAVEIPSVGKEAFGSEWSEENNSAIYYTLYVPEQSLDLYKKADGWKDFVVIRPIITEGIESAPVIANVAVSKQADNYVMSFSKTVRAVLFVDVDGKQLGIKNVDGQQLVIKNSELDTPYILIQVCYADDTKEVVKLKK